MSEFFRILLGVPHLRFAEYLLKYNKFEKNVKSFRKLQKIHTRTLISNRITSPTEPNRKMSSNDGKSDCSSNEVNKDWRGCTLEEIHRNLNEFELEHLPPVHPSDTHTVLHEYPIRGPIDEPARPLRGHHKWDAHHVRLPCSAKSQYPVTGEDGNMTIDSRWEMIERALLRPIANSHELEEAILVYNSRYKDQWHFVALHKLFEEELDESESKVFFEDLLPRIIRLALRLPELVQSAVPLLKQGQTHSLTLTQEQISCLLANGFLCTYPRRNTMKRKSEYSTFPDINFNRLFQSTGHQVLEKIKCICHYFRRVCPTEQSNRNVPTGVVTFTRRSLHYSDMPNWSECTIPFSSTLLHITSSGTIEDQGFGLLQVDFANKFLGGGVLGRGCVQEEIRFVICPELLISKLFTECLRPTEALLMVGCERYSNYTGYAGSFQWAGNHDDIAPRDSSRRRQTHIVAIDALAFVQSSHQYREELMLRELNKAYVGFYHPLETPAPGVASGNWGCGAFGGEVTLKALIQLMACAVNKRPLVYFTFGNAQLRDEVYKLHTFLGEQNVRVCDLWATLKKFHTQNTDANQLYQFIYNCHSKKGVKYQTICKKSEDRSQKAKEPMTGNNLKNSTGSITHPIVNDSTSTTASTSKIDAKTQQRNIGSYFVAVSSDCSSSDQHSSIWKEKPSPTNLPSTEPQTPKSILLLGDSATDDCSVVPAAVVENTVENGGHERSQNGKSSIPNTSPISTVQKRSQPKQRTLLEMLDNTYTSGNQAKRSKS